MTNIQVLDPIQPVKVMSREKLMKSRPQWEFEDGVLLKEHVRPILIPGLGGKQEVVHEFIGTDNFGANFYERQSYEVDAGRDSEPILYTPFYQVTESASLPRLVSVNRLGPGQVIFSQIEEGGEVKFVTIGQSNFSVPIYQYAAGLQYSKALVMFNELWSVAEVERQAGKAYNALLNHLHLNPIITGTYAGSNYTDGTALTFDTAATLPEKYLRTIETAIATAVADSTNPRRGPYGLLVATGQSFTAERALNTVPQQGFTLQSSAIGRIRNVVAYDGWTGVRGNLTVTYGGVDSGYAYLVDLGLVDYALRSYVKQGFQRVTGNPDVSRFILEQTVWDSWLGTYTNYAAAVHRIKWPT